MGCDVVIVGAGPAGLMAAKTAAEQGLKVVVIEKRKAVYPITRACCQQLIMDENFQGETIKLEPGKIIFSRNGFQVNYAGPTFSVTDKYYLSPGGHKIHFAYDDKRPIVVKFDKGFLLQGLWQQCETLGVTFKNAAVAYDVRDSARGVKLSLSSGGRHSTLKAKKIIIADGVNSRMAEALGMNKTRIFFTTGLCVIFLLEGIKDYEPTALKSHMGLAYQSRAPLILSPSLTGENRGWLVTIGNSNLLPEQIYRKTTTSGPLSSVLGRARIVKKMGCAVKSFSSMRVPCLGNALCIGDAAAFVEVEVQGALTCGFRAGTAVYKELSGEQGFEEYTRWWQQSFEFNSDDYMQVARGYALVPTYTDDELDYLFTIIEDEVLPGTFSQYKSPKLMWDAILRHHEKIEREKPELYGKIKNKKLTLSDAL